MGRVKCWGDNDSGRLGINSMERSLVPAPVEALTGDAFAVDAGLYNTCALLADGVHCWGRATSYFSKVGNALVPQFIAGFSGTVTQIALGNYQVCAIAGGAVQCSGSRSIETVEGLAGASALAAGSGYACAIVDGAAKCWGQNTVGQLGDGTTVSRAAPVQVQGLDSGVTAIGASSGSDPHTCALANGAVYCWGDNGFGELGNGEKTDSPAPVKVVGLDGNVSAIAVGGFHTCAVIEGKVACWGWNDYGQLGTNSRDNSASPVWVQGLPADVTALDCDGRHSCAIAGQKLYCWGDNQYGQLGIGSTNNQLVAVEIALAD